MSRESGVDSAIGLRQVRHGSITEESTIRVTYGRNVMEIMVTGTQGCSVTCSAIMRRLRWSVRVLLKRISDQADPSLPHCP